MEGILSQCIHRPNYYNIHNLNKLKFCQWYLSKDESKILELSKSGDNLASKSIPQEKLKEFFGLKRNTRWKLELYEVMSKFVGQQKRLFFLSFSNCLVNNWLLKKKE